MLVDLRLFNIAIFYPLPVGVCFNAVNPETFVNGLSVLTSTFFGVEVVLIGVKLATLTLVGGFETVLGAFIVLRAVGFTAAVLVVFNVLKAEGLTAATLVVGVFVLNAPVKLALVLLTLVVGVLVKEVSLFAIPVTAPAVVNPVFTVDAKLFNVSLPVSFASKFKPPTVLSASLPVVNVDTLLTASEFELASTVEPANNTAFIMVASFTVPLVTN